MNNNTEVWKDVQGYEGLYQVSNLGRVRSLDRTIIDSIGRKRLYKGKLLKPIIDNHGYFEVLLYKGTNRKPPHIHRLVAQTFLPNPKKLPCINHIDENKQNNAVSNLEWCSYKYNNNYGTRTDRAIQTRGRNPEWYKKIKEHTGKIGKKYGRINGAKMSKPVLQFDLDGDFIREWPSMREVKHNLKIDNSSIARCCKGKQKTAGKYIWKFK